MLEFHFHPGPNPMKIALFLAETELDFELIPVDTLKGEQHSAAFRAINPNGKTPAIVDEGQRVFDSNAILLYLAEKTGQLGGQPEERAELLSWLMFVATGLGPYSGQCVHFRHAAPSGLDYAVNRYLQEARRHYAVLEKHLEGRQFIVGEALTIADLAAWGWIDKAEVVLGEEGLTPYPNLKRWFDMINRRPATARARAIGQGIDFKTAFDDEARRALFPSNHVDEA